MWTSRTLHPVKSREDTFKVKRWIRSRRWTNFIKKPNGQQTDNVRKNIIGVFNIFVLALRLKLLAKKQIF